MFRCTLNGLLPVLLVCSPVGITASAALVPDTKVLPRLKTEPVIDGKITNPETNGALALGKLSGNDGPPSTDTEVWVGLGKEALYIAVRCEEPLVSEIKGTTIADQKDAAVWLDDCIEVFIDSGNTRRNLYHLISNAHGVSYDAESLNGQEIRAWDSGMKVATQIGKDRWDLEMTIPYSALNGEFVRGEVFGLNIGRTRYAGGKPESSSLIKGKFSAPRLFPEFLIEGEVEKGTLKLVSTQRGPLLQNEEGAWKFVLDNSGKDPVTVEAEFASGIRKRHHQAEPGKSTFDIKIPKGKSSDFSGITITTDGLLYTSHLESRSGEISGRVADISHPKFQELMVNNPEGLSAEGFLRWAHELIADRAQGVAVRAGTTYHWDEIFQRYKEEGAIILRNCADMGLNPDYPAPPPARSSAAYCKKYQVPYAIMLSSSLDWIAAKKAGAPLAWGSRPWFLDPRAIKVYLEDARRAIMAGKNDPLMWGIFVGDESWERLHKELLWFVDQKMDYPELQAANEEVKAKFGFGKYGFPESSADKNPFRWIATIRWEISKMMEIQKQIRKMVEEECPRLKMVSWDGYARTCPFDVYRWKEVFDVITGQLYPSSNPFRDDFGFLTQFYKDVSGAKEIWMCAHVEHYAANFTPQETRLLLSQMVRGGATGLHYYPDDTKGRRAGVNYTVTDDLGNPERAQVVRNFTDMLKKPFQVKEPQADTAIFYSNTSYQGQSPKNPPTGEVEWAYTVLGFRNHGKLQFVDEGTFRGGAEALKSFKAIYVPYAPIVDDKEYQVLEDYVLAGGILVVCDPEAFRFRSDGTRREEARLSPSDGKPLGRSPEIQPTAKDLSPMKGYASLYSLPSGGDVFATAQQDPAIIRVREGEGSVVKFGTNPFQPPVIRDANWGDFFRWLQKDVVGASTDSDYWNFQLPAVAAKETALPAALCLTGNYVTWYRNEAITEAAPETNIGSYRLSRPDTNGEPGGVDILFSKGKLTDRPTSFGRRMKTANSESLCRWEAGTPLDIEVKLGRTADLRELRFWFMGDLPAGVCEVSSDGVEWVAVGSWKAHPVMADFAIHAEKIPFEGIQGNRVRLKFEDGKDGSSFSLTELEIWGNPPTS